MAKAVKTVFFCKECGYESAKWLGHCPGCSAWNSFVEEKVQSANATDKYSSVPRSECKKLNDIQTSETIRFSTGYEELDRVLGRRYSGWLFNTFWRRTRNTGNPL